VSFWTIPPMWFGKTVAILASGPSLTGAVAEAVRCVGVPTIAINDTFRRAPWADMLYAADPEWWRVNPEALDFAGLRASVSKVDSVLQLQNTGVEGFDPHPFAIRTGGNSGYQAVHIAIHAGAARVLLCGFDMHNRCGLHWHGSHPRPLRNTDEHSYAKWASRFEALKGIGPEIVNCTPGSAIECFPKMDLNEALHEYHDHHAAVV